MSRDRNLVPPVAPQLARSRRELPESPGLVYEPKLDGYRAIVFVDGSGGDAYIQSRGGKPLRRYFPELLFPDGRYVVDGEIVLRVDGAEDFGALGQRIHPAASRVAELAETTPASYVAFDLLALAGEVLLDRPYSERRALLEEAFAAGAVECTPVTEDPEKARRWLVEREGVIAKEAGEPYRPGERKGMTKIKRLRTASCVVMGWRPGKAEGTVGSLIIGLHEPDGRLRPVGHCSGFRAAQKRDLRELLAPLETGRQGSAEASRWTAGRELEWVEIRPELVGEFSFDHASGGRIRHGARLLGWRDDIDPSSCGVDQLSD